jgi:branched-chain amino acid transport system ATP-binding protein
MAGEVTRSSPGALLRVIGLSKRFGGLIATRDVNLSIPAGSVHAIIGPNGAGKTTVFNCITAFFQPSAGEIWLGDRRIDGMAPHRVAAHGISRTYQNVRLFSNMTAIENVLVGGHRQIRTPIWHVVMATSRFRQEERAARERARELLEFVGIADRADMLARNMAYGDQRRLEIARALATQPRLLMLDEPAAGMNPSEGMALATLMDRIRAELGVTIILIEHHMRVVMAVADRVTVFDRGAVLAEGDPAEIQSDERVVRAYLGAQPTVRTPEAQAESATIAGRAEVMAS